MPLEFSRVTVAGPLVLLPAIKAHLRLTDTAHDGEAQATFDRAQDAILAYLTTAGDATWTDTTVPLSVAHAILLLTTHYYEHRGDDMDPQQSGGTPDAKVWEAIRELLGRHRDPTLG